MAASALTPQEACALLRLENDYLRAQLAERPDPADTERVETAVLRRLRRHVLLLKDRSSSALCREARARQEAALLVREVSSTGATRQCEVSELRRRAEVVAAEASKLRAELGATRRQLALQEAAALSATRAVEEAVAEAARRELDFQAAVAAGSRQAAATAAAEAAQLTAQLALARRQAEGEAQRRQAAEKRLAEAGVEAARVRRELEAVRRLSRGTEVPAASEAGAVRRTAVAASQAVAALERELGASELLMVREYMAACGRGDAGGVAAAKRRMQSVETRRLAEALDAMVTAQRALTAPLAAAAHTFCQQDAADLHRALMTAAAVKDRGAADVVQRLRRVFDKEDVGAELREAGRRVVECVRRVK